MCNNSFLCWLLCQEVCLGLVAITQALHLYQCYLVFGENHEGYALRVLGVITG
jgi:hypothetical protein